MRNNRDELAWLLSWFWFFYNSRDPVSLHGKIPTGKIFFHALCEDRAIHLCGFRHHQSVSLSIDHVISTHNEHRFVLLEPGQCGKERAAHTKIQILLLDGR